ncbi:MAG: hypothetical protein HYV60_11920 [Planctomycetia bacterium]|nr:hypothetical protein [Planctomycetia bacterium]
MEILPVAPSWSFANQAAAFVADILYDRQPLSSAADAVKDIRLIEAIWRSAR